MQYSLYNKHFTTVFTTVLRLISLLNCPIELVFGSEARLVHSQLAVHCRDSLRACLCLNRVKKRDFTTHRKIPKIRPGAYIFQRPFLRGLFLEGLIFGGAYLRGEICVSNSIGLAL